MVSSRHTPTYTYMQNTPLTASILGIHWNAGTFACKSLYSNDLAPFYQLEHAGTFTGTLERFRLFCVILLHF